MKKLLTISIIVLASCFKPSHKESAATFSDTTRVTRTLKPASSFQNILIVSEACALFYQPDSIQRAKIKAMRDEGIFEAATQGFFYRQGLAHKFLKERWPHLKIVEAKYVRFLAFIRKDGSSDIVDLDKLNDAYGLFVFDKIKPPVQIDMANTETRILDYFKKNKQ